MGAGKRYSAGAIFLQVVPVFANVQRAIENEAKNIDRALGDQMERSGEKAGDRAGKAASKAMKDQVAKAGIDKELEKQFHDSAKGIEKALGDIDTSKMGDRVKREVRAMRAELDTLSKVDINVDDNFNAIQGRLAAVRSHLKEMEKGSKLRLNMAGLTDVYRATAAAQAAIDKIDGTINLDANTKPVEREMSIFEKKFKAVTQRAAKSLSGDLTKEARKVKDELKYLEKLRVGIDFSSSRAMSELKEVREELEDLHGKTVEPDLKIALVGAIAEIVAFEALLDKIDGRDVDVDVDVDKKGSLLRAGRDAESSANSFRSFNVILLAVVSAGPALIPVLGGIAGGLLAIGPAAGVAAFGLSSVLVGFSGLGDALSALQSQQDAAATNAQSSAKRHEAAANQIRNAQRAVADAERNAARAAEDAAERVADARRNAARAAEDAAERVADARERAAEANEDAQERIVKAREDAAEAIEDALERQKDAQEEYRDAIDDVRDAEQALADARAEAQEDAESLSDRQRQNAVDERQAVLDLFNAQSEYNAIMASGSSTNTDKEQAAINLEQAQIALNETRDEQVALAEEADDYAKNGVDGSEKVKSAQEKLTEAIEDQAKALADMHEAAEEADKARIEGQEAIREATRAADEARRDGAEMVSDALEDQREILSDNARAVKNALEDQAESHDDNARAIQRAKEALGDARKSAVDDLAAIDSQAAAVEAAFDKLGPAGAKFALFLFSLKSGFYEFRDAVQTAMLPAVQQAIESFIASPTAAVAKGAFVALAAGFGEFTKALSTSFQGEAWTSFFEMLGGVGVQIQDAWGAAFIALMEAIASILVTTAPFALEFAEGLAKMMEGFAAWSASAEGQAAFLNFIAYVKEIGPAVLAFFGSLAGAFVAAAKALAPYGEMVLTALTGVLDFLAATDEAMLAALLTALTVVLLSSQVAYAVMNAMKAGAALFATAVGPWVFAIIGIGIALAVLYKKNEEFAAFIDKAWGRIKEVFSEAWKSHIKPALTELWDALNALWNDVLVPLFRWLEPILMWVINNLLPLLLWAFAHTIRDIANIIEYGMLPGLKMFGYAFKRSWEDFIKPAWDALAAASIWLWEKVLKPTFKFIADAAMAAFRFISKAWNKVLWPVIKTIGKVIWKLWKTYFDVVFVLIKAGWKALAAAFDWVWKNVLEKVFGHVARVGRGLWDNVLRPAFRLIRLGWDAMSAAMGIVWREHLKPIFDAFVEDVLPHLQTAFETTIDAIQKLWEGLKRGIGTPIKFIIETVLNDGLIDGFNKIAGWVGADDKKIDHIPVPKAFDAYATGGILPGYTPGRDVHTFRSPTAGTLALSGGEAIMRPEWTAAVGSGFVDSMNRLAATGGVKAVKGALGKIGGFWNGGVLPLLGGSVSSHGSSYGHPAYDMNYPGYADFGAAIRAWKDGILAQKNFIGDQSYGRWAVVNHDNGLSSLYAHLSAFADAAVGQRVRAGQTIGYVGDIGNTGTPPTSHLHFEIMGGNVGYTDNDVPGAGKKGKPRRSIPDWLGDFVTGPLDAVKGWVADPIKGAAASFRDTPIFDVVSRVPSLLVGAIKDRAVDILPDWVKSAGNLAGKALDKAGDVLGSVGDGVSNAADSLGFRDGGILPYNGTMMYDAGGYLPPGLTTVMNLTGKPEPVFTADQFEGLGLGDGGFTYAPTLVGTDLTPADLVDDLDFARRKAQRGGKYGRSKP